MKYYFVFVLFSQKLWKYPSHITDDLITCVVE